MTKKQNVEIDLVRRLFEALSVSGYVLQPSDKPDVLAEFDGHRIGIEVTTLHADEGQNVGGGSAQRKAEEHISRKRAGRPYAMWGTVNPKEALVARIKAKAEHAASYRNQNLNELWLLISASLPQLGAAASTFIFPPAVNLEYLNGRTDEILRDSPFSKVYLHLILGRTLYEWTRDKKWRLLQASQATSHGSELWFKSLLRDPEWLRDPRGKARTEAMKALEELRAMRRN